MSVYPTHRRATTNLTAGKRLLITAFAITAFAITACTSAAPSQCVQAAENAGLPESVIEEIKNPGGLNAIERIALRELLKKAGLDDVCDQIN